jgi:AmmeMemoRadiSam system protein B
MSKATHRRLVICICIGVILACCLTGCQKSENVPPHTVSEATHSNNFFDVRYFQPEPLECTDDNDGCENKPPIFDKIHGVVVPHHLLAHKLISRVFSQISGQKPSLLILLGPNHYNEGARILTSSWDWQTPFGTVETDRDTVNKLLASSMVKRDEAVFENEHSIGNLMPFIKYYLPDAKVVPIILHHDVNQKEAKSISKQLSGLVEEGAIIIASVDFSHYLTRQEAEKKDGETIDVLKANDLARLFSMGNDHLDSPAALGTLFMTMEDQDIRDFTILDNTNSGILLDNDMIETTSYMIIIFK